MSSDGSRTPDSVGAVSPVDAQEAFDSGAFAVQVAGEGGGSVAIQYDGSKTVLKNVPLKAVAGKTRHMPDDFMKPDANQLSEAGMAYLMRLVPESDVPKALALMYGGQAIAAAFAFFVATDMIERWSMLVLVAIYGTIMAFIFPTRTTIVPSLVERDHLANAIALNAAAQNATRVFGPTLAASAHPLRAAG